MRDLSHRLAHEHDVRALLPQILDAAIELTQAERGFLVLTGGKRKIRVEHARGFDRETLQGAQGKVSRTVVERVLERRGGLVTTSEGDADIPDVPSVQARRVLSILCVPMMLRGQIKGVLYLDHRFDRSAFTEHDLPIVSAFADQAGLALETAELMAERVQRAEEAGTTETELERLRAAQTAREDAPALVERARDGEVQRFGRLLGGSEVMQALYEEIERASRSEAPVLITGESGTGKELVAREIHGRSSKDEDQFVSESCAVLSDASLGVEPFAIAPTGTLFLDEIGDLTSTAQARLLRALQERHLQPKAERGRVIAATHRDLRQLVAEDRFREDLYYRLDVLRITVPPLRQRPDDIPALFETVLRETSPAPIEVTDKAWELLVAYAWPGNVRELENEARRLAAIGVERISARQLSEEIRAGRGLARAEGSYAGKTLGEVERDMVAAALRESGGNKARAARQLGIPKTTLYHLLDRYGLKG